MRPLIADLHVHVGTTLSGQAVKVTASRRLSLGAIREAAVGKGLDLVAAVDLLNPELQAELQGEIDQDRLRPLAGGGLRWRGGPVLLPAAEVEGAEGAHLVAFFPDLDGLRGFGAFLSNYGRHFHLGCPRVNLALPELAEQTAKQGGFLLPAHAFTPHKGLWGKLDQARDLLEAAPPGAIPAVELGLSADNDLALRLRETWPLTYLSASDAHSEAKMAREYTVIRAKEASFMEMHLALKERSGRLVLENVGLDPALGKYHRTHCPVCRYTARGELPPVGSCPQCGNKQIIVGVLDRIAQLASLQDSTACPAPARPAYRRHVPLELIPGLGPRRRAKLLQCFGSEMAVLREASEDELAAVVGERLARRLEMGRQGRLSICPGGGGYYGKVLAESG